MNIIGRPPQSTGRVNNCQRSVNIPGSVDLNTNESLSVSLGKIEPLKQHYDKIFSNFFY